jgi:hypothetical protein
MLLSYGYHKTAFRHCQKWVWSLRWWKFGTRCIQTLTIVRCSDVSEQIVTLYTDDGCGTVATVGSNIYKDFKIPIGCTNTGSDASLTSTTADCNPGQFMLVVLCACCILCCSSNLTCGLSASHLSVSIMFSCTPPPHFKFAVCKLDF